MNSIGWPKMFSNSNTIVKTENEATLTCMHLLVSSEEGTFEWDPEFGIKIRRFYYEQNNYVLRNILIDELYTKITIFCPQLFLERKNIKIRQEGKKLIANIYCKNRDNFETNLYDLTLFEEDKGE